MKSNAPQRVENGNWLTLPNKLRRRFGSAPTSFTNSAAEKMDSISTIGLRPNRKCMAALIGK